MIFQIPALSLYDISFILLIQNLFDEAQNCY